MAVDGHAVLPLARQEVPGVVAVPARVEAAVGAHGAGSPAVIGHYCVPDRAGKGGNFINFMLQQSQPA